MENSKEDIDECIYNFTYCIIGTRISNWFELGRNSGYRLDR